jgi:hypothetical protein
MSRLPELVAIIRERARAAFVVAFGFTLGRPVTHVLGATQAKAV